MDGCTRTGKCTMSQSGSMNPPVHNIYSIWRKVLGVSYSSVIKEADALQPIPQTDARIGLLHVVTKDHILWRFQHLI